jgi:hypothetical protein
MILEALVALTGIVVFTMVLIAGYLIFTGFENQDDGDRR